MACFTADLTMLGLGTFINSVPSHPAIEAAGHTTRGSLMAFITTSSACTWLTRIIDKHKLPSNGERARDMLNQSHPRSANAIPITIGQHISTEGQNETILGQTANDEGVRHFVRALVNFNQNSSIFRITNKDLTFSYCNRRNRERK